MDRPELFTLGVVGIFLLCIIGGILIKRSRRDAYRLGKLDGKKEVSGKPIFLIDLPSGKYFVVNGFEIVPDEGEGHLYGGVVIETNTGEIFCTIYPNSFFYEFLIREREFQKKGEEICPCETSPPTVH